MVERVSANRPFGYGEQYPMLDRGQVFELAGLPNDERLTRLGYCAIVESSYQTSDCGECGAQFIGDAERAAHGRVRHGNRVLTPLEEDQRADREEKLIEQVAPLNLDKTVAAQRAGTVSVPRVRVPE